MESESSKGDYPITHFHVLQTSWGIFHLQATRFSHSQLLYQVLKTLFLICLHK